MAETTGIAWTDATQNFWEGCTKVGPGCDHCYAEARDLRFHEGSHWGVGAPRRRMATPTFNRPLTWNRARELYNAAGGDHYWEAPTPPLWVFSLSLGDFFDNAVDPQWRADAWAIIRRCTALRWQLVTKRVGNVRAMLPDDWGDGSAYRHVGIIATVVTQGEANRDVPKLAVLKDHGVRWVGLSIEPMLEAIDLNRAWPLHDLNWVICGGESQQGAGHVARPFHLAWAGSLLHQCRGAGVPFFMKQVGDSPVMTTAGVCAGGLYATRAGTKPEGWPEELRVREMPRVYEVAP